MKSPSLHLGMLFLCGLLTGVSSEAQRAYTIAVIPKGTSHEFWKSIHAGAIKGQRELESQGYKINMIWRGPLREDDRDQQIQVVENFIVRRAHGIVLAPLDSQALVAPVEAATRARIPVIIIDSGLNSTHQVAYISTDNFKGGQIAAEHLGTLLEGKGKVILLRYMVGSASTEEREAGFLDVMTKRFPNIELLSTNQYSGATRDLAQKAAENLLSRYGREADGIFAPCEPVTIGVMHALRDYGRGKGSVKLVGFDSGSASVEGLKHGEVHGLVVQNPMQMGYLGVTTMVRHLEGKPIEKQVDTGVYLVTPANMNEPHIQELLHPPLHQYLK